MTGRHGGDSVGWQAGRQTDRGAVAWTITIYKHKSNWLLNNKFIERKIQCWKYFYKECQAKVYRECISVQWETAELNCFICLQYCNQHYSIQSLPIQFYTIRFKLILFSSIWVSILLNISIAILFLPILFYTILSYSILNNSIQF